MKSLVLSLRPNCLSILSHLIRCAALDSRFHSERFHSVRLSGTLQRRAERRTSSMCTSLSHRALRMRVMRSFVLNSMHYGRPAGRPGDANVSLCARNSSESGSSSSIALHCIALHRITSHRIAFRCSAVAKLFLRIKTGRPAAAVQCSTVYAVYRRVNKVKSIFVNFIKTKSIYFEERPNSL